MANWHLLLCSVVTKDRVADKEVAERNDGHRNKVIPTQCWENGKIVQA